MEWNRCPNRLIQPISQERYLIERKQIVPSMLPVIRRVNRDKRIVFASGCFDILHTGHLEFLLEAREQGDMLVVGVNSDSSIRQLKGPSRPVMPDYKRAPMICSFTMANYVFLFDELDVSAHIRSLRPDIYTVFEESVYDGKPELIAAAETGACVHIVGRYGQDNSSTYLLSKGQGTLELGQ